MTGVVAGLLTAGGGHAWETDVVAALDRPGAPLTVIRRCADIADVLAMASTGQAVACLLAADLRRLDSESVQQLRAFGVTVVAVHAVGDQWAPVRLERIGVRFAVPDDVGASAMIGAVREALADSGDAPGPAGAPRSTADPRWALGSAAVGPGAVDAAGDEASAGDGPAVGLGRPGAGREGAGPEPVASDPIPGGVGGGASAAGPVAPGVPPGHGARHGDAPATRAPGPPGGPRVAEGSVPSAGRQPAGSVGVVSLASSSGGPGVAGSLGLDPGGGSRPPGTVLAVWGPGGAPGRSTVAMGLADCAAVAGRSVLLVDADVYGGVLASAFGLMDESPGLAGACRLAANGRLDTADLASLCWRIGDAFALLTGIARADRWPEVRPSAIPTVLQMARQLAELVVVDCSAVLETDEEISFDTMAPRRNGATLAVLDDADSVLAVGSADPPGLERLVRGLSEFGAAVDRPAPMVVLNRVRRTSASTGDLAAAVRRFAGTEPIALLPEDRAACDRAWQRGVPLSAAAPKSTLVAGLRDLVGALVPVPAGA